MGQIPHKQELLHTLNCIIKVCFFQNLPVQIELLLLQIQVSLHNNVAV